MSDRSRYRLNRVVPAMLRGHSYAPFKPAKAYVFRPNSDRVVNAVLELNRLQARINELENVIHMNCDPCAATEQDEAIILEINRRIFGD